MCREVEEFVILKRAGNIEATTQVAMRNAPIREPPLSGNIGRGVGIDPCGPRNKDAEYGEMGVDICVIGFPAGFTAVLPSLRESPERGETDLLATILRLR